MTESLNDFTAIPGLQGLAKRSTQVLERPDHQPLVFRRLTVRDRLSDFVKSIPPTVSGVTIPAEDRRLESYLLDNTKPFFFGPELTYQNAFGVFTMDPDTGESGELLQVTLTCVSPSFPQWYLIANYKKPDSDPATLAFMWESCIRAHAIEGYLMFSTCYPADKIEAHRRLWKHTENEKLYGANTISTLDVPANTRPPFSEVFNILMSRQMWPKDMVVRTFLLDMTEQQQTELYSRLVVEDS